METRKGLATYSDLPNDYLKMVGQVFQVNFDAGLQALHKRTEMPASFMARGRVYPGEIVLCISLQHKGKLAATSVYASMDYDPKASSPTIEDLLAAGVDAVGAVFGQLLIADNGPALDRLTDESLSTLENVPFQWSELQVERHRIFVKVDKANPALEEMAESWLEQNDPERASKNEADEKATEELFVTGPKRPSGSNSG